MFLTNDISDIYLTPLSANHLLTRDLMALDAMLSMSVFLGRFSATPKKKRTNECPA